MSWTLWFLTSFPRCERHWVPISLTKRSLSKILSTVAAWQAIGLILFFDPDAVESPPCYKCSSNHVGLYRLSVLKLFDQFFFPSPSRWWSRSASAFCRARYCAETGYLHGTHGKVSSHFLWLQSSCIFPPKFSDNSFTRSRISPADLGRKCFQDSKA